MFQKRWTEVDIGTSSLKMGAWERRAPGKRQNRSKDLRQEEGWRVEWAWHAVASGKLAQGRWE